ncbi:MAG TPA: hypothetical protein VJ733_11305 [Candidatus Binatia bacterium]|nr:hypothetical protein [Candidatus Binatia bacterium]
MNWEDIIGFLGNYWQWIVGLLVIAIVPFINDRLVSRRDRVNRVAAAKANFSSFLTEDIAALESAENISTDALAILKERFDIQHKQFIDVYSEVDLASKCGLRAAWKEYYGEENEQDWYLPNEYSVLMSNQLKNTAENTKKLAICRIKALVKICS